jgi:DNA-binding transcriptional LysR family regulator
LAGPIRLAAPMSFGIKVLGLPLAAFLDQHPAVEIDVLLSDARNDPVAEGIDLTLRISPLADPACSRGRSRPSPRRCLPAPPIWRNMEPRGIRSTSPAIG